MLADNDTKKRVLADILHTIHAHEMDEGETEDTPSAEDSCPYCGKDSGKANSGCRMHSYQGNKGGKKTKGKAAMIVGIKKK